MPCHHESSENNTTYIADVTKIRQGERLDIVRLV
jgi:hypothetical protein